MYLGTWAILAQAKAKEAHLLGNKPDETEINIKSSRSKHTHMLAFFYEESKSKSVKSVAF